MRNNNSRKTGPMFQMLCLLMAGLMGCSTTRSQNVWHDLSTQKPRAGKGLRNLDSWGERPASLTAVDPFLAPGFQISLHSLADSKMDGDYRIEYDGNLALPYGVNVNTTGLTLGQLKAKLPDLYQSYFKTPPAIELKIKERRVWVDVRGLVEKPGRYLVDQDASFDQVIGSAGGTSKSSVPQYVRIQKGQDVFIFDLNQYYSQGADRPQINGWLGGEIVFLQKEMAGSAGEGSTPYRLPVYILGEVRKPGEYTFIPGSNFLDSLIQAGGFTERADLDNIEIVRRAGKKTRVFGFSWEDFQEAPAPVQGDLILVHADRTSRLERRTVLMATIISALAAIATSTVLILAYRRDRL